MKDRGLKQIDILNSTNKLCEQYDVKFNKSDISQYVSGKTEPNQDKLFILSEALGVDVVWLMGYDVPMNSIKLTNDQLSNFDKKYNIDGKLTEQVSTLEEVQNQYGNSMIEMMQLFNELNEAGKQKAIENISDLSEISRYQK